MRRRIAVPAVLALSFILGCGGTDPVDIQPVVCTIQFTGALTQTTPCGADRQVVALRSASPDSSTVTGGLTGTPALAVYLRYQGAPTVGTYSNTSTGARGFVSASSGSSGWIATTTGMAGNPTPQGTWTITLTSVTAGPATANGTPYTMHGTIDATMPSASGGGTALTVKVTF